MKNVFRVRELAHILSSIPDDALVLVALDSFDPTLTPAHGVSKCEWLTAHDGNDTYEVCLLQMSHDEEDQTHLNTATKQ